LEPPTNLKAYEFLILHPEAAMTKHLRCRDLGMNCDFEARGATEDDIMRQAADHAKRAHQISEIPPELASQVRAAIRTE
jgi:predicted small metal-binding protein